VDNEGEESLVKRHVRLLGLLSGTLDGDDQIPEDFILKTVCVGKGDDIGGAVLAEAFFVECRDAPVVGKEDAQVPIPQP